MKKRENTNITTKAGNVSLCGCELNRRWNIINFISFVWITLTSFQELLKFDNRIEKHDNHQFRKLSVTWSLGTSRRNSLLFFPSIIY